MSWKNSRFWFEVVKIAGQELLRSHRPILSSPMPVVALEHIPNRNCLGYLDSYGIPNVERMCRGTFRYEFVLCYSQNIFKNLVLSTLAAMKIQVSAAFSEKKVLRRSEGAVSGRGNLLWALNVRFPFVRAWLLVTYSPSLLS